MSTSPCRPSHSPTWQECCPGALLFAQTFYCELCCCLATWECFTSWFTASTTPSQWCCVWASLQRSASWWRSSASKQRFEKRMNCWMKFTRFATAQQALLARRAVTNIWPTSCLHPDGCDILPRRALRLLHGHVPLWTCVGNCSPLPICKYRRRNEPRTSEGVSLDVGKIRG